MNRCSSTAVSNVGARLWPLRMASANRVYSCPMLKGSPLREIGGHVDESRGNGEVQQLVAALGALHPQHLAALRRDTPGYDEGALAPVDLHAVAAAGPGDGAHVDRDCGAASFSCPLTRTLSGDVTSTC